MGLKYNRNILPFTEQRVVAAFGTMAMGAKPMSGGELTGTPGVYRVLSGHSSAYIVPAGNGQVVLIDAGMEEDAGNICATLKRMGYDASAVQAIFVTHGHIDHVAGVHVFEAAHVYAHESERAYLAGEKVGDGTLGKLLGKLPSAQALRPERIVPITDTQVVTIGDVAVTAYATPGHTHGSMSYQIGEMLFVGDALSFDKKGNPMLMPSMMTADTASARQSIKTIAENGDKYATTTIVASHSGEGSLDALKLFTKKA